MNEDKRETVANRMLLATKNAFGMHRDACGIVVGRTPIYFYFGFGFDLPTRSTETQTARLARATGGCANAFCQAPLVWAAAPATSSDVFERHVRVVRPLVDFPFSV